MHLKLSNYCQPAETRDAFRAYLNISQHISTYLNISQHISGYLNISQDISAYLSVWWDEAVFPPVEPRWPRFWPLTPGLPHRTRQRWQDAQARDANGRCRVAFAAIAKPHDVILNQPRLLEIMFMHTTNLEQPIHCVNSMFSINYGRILCSVMFLEILNMLIPGVSVRHSLATPLFCSSRKI